MTTLDETIRKACLVAVTGSKAYGLDHPDSDTDRMGVFIDSTLKVAGLHWNKNNESYSNASSNGDDLTMHEVGKFLRLCLKGNPTLIELLFMNEYEVLTETGKSIIENRDILVSESTLRSSYHGYAYSQLQRVTTDKEFKPKMARHVLRIARQGYTLLTTRTFNVKVDDPQEYFDLTNLPFNHMISKISAEVDKLKFCDSVLPSVPDTETITHLLESIRKNNI